MSNLISTKPIVKQSEDEFLAKFRDKVIEKFKLTNDSKVFILRYAIGDDMIGYFTHLNADIFDELNESKRETNEKFKKEIEKLIIDKSDKYQDVFSKIGKRFNTEVLRSNNPTPINTYLCQIYQYLADFSQGFLGYFYPFCQLTKKCFKENEDFCCVTGSFSYVKLKKCGFWLDITTAEEKNKILNKIKNDNNEFLDNINTSFDKKTNVLKYYLLSEIESKLFNFGSEKGSLICIPIIRRGQCNTLIFIDTKSQLGKNDENLEYEENILNEIINEINQFYDDQFYFSFFTLLDEESNYAKILAKPEILSKIFNLKTPSSGNSLIELKESKKLNGNKGVSLKLDKDTSKVEIEFYNYTLSFYTNTFIDDFNKVDIEIFLQQFINSLEQVNKVKDSMAKKNLKIAIISILVDSYAHNISAHSLSALKWWFELRHKILDKRFYVEKNYGIKLSHFHPTEIEVNQEKLEQLSEKYYAALGLTDSTYNKEFFSLFDYLQFNIENNSDVPKRSGKLFSFLESNQHYSEGLLRKNPDFQGKVSFINENDRPNDFYNPTSFSPRFPVSFDYALFPFFRFLRDKGAFWSGVTRDMAFGGESKTWYKILWEDFANNPLYLGTIAKSEGITKLKINLAIKYNNEWITGRFVTIDLSLMDLEERIANNPRLEIEYEKKDFQKIEPYLTELGIKKEEIHDKERLRLRSDIRIKVDRKLNEILFSADKFDEIHCEDDQVDGKDHEFRCKESKEKHIRNKDYSKYAFVRLGKCFAHFREILNQEDYSVFLPGGVVGEHALFTILENSLRNIKHYKNHDELAKIKQEGIDFWISIEKESHYKHKLNNTNTPDQFKKPEELFRIAVWLGHKTSLISKEDQGEKVCLWERVTETTSKPLLDINGNPKMGGNSQDKACAAMLFNNRFISVDDQSDKNINYYPWLHFTTNNTQFPNNNDYNDLPMTRIDCLKQNLDYEQKKSEFLTNPPLEEGYLKKHLYLWRSSDYIIVNNESDLEGENISRFKFVIISNNVPDINKTLSFARQEGTIRLIFNQPNINIKEIIDELEVNIPSKFNSDNNKPSSGELDLNEKIKDERLEVLYDIWLRQWVPFNNKTQIAFCRDQNNSVLEFQESHKVVLEFKRKEESAHIITLSHGGGDEFQSCNVRSHGSFWGKYFNEIVGKQPEDLIKPDISLDTATRFNSLMYDFAEVILTKVFIYDNRLKSRMPTNHKKLQVFENNLNIIVREEEKLGNDSQGGGFQFGLFKNQLTTEIKNNGVPHVLIVHLSYIESMGYKETTEGFMNLFIENELTDIIDLDNFIFIIVTGRGRNSWKENLKPEYFRNTLFKPVESFIHAIESGVSYNDNFDVKHNIIKVIFGS